MGFLSRLFGRPNAASDSGLYYHVRCDACGEVIRGRVNPATELSQDEEGTYFVRKVLVGRQCFRPVELHLRYADVRGKELSREARGGTFVDEA